ncbi:MAG TPA: hypothetical protein VF594_01425 [Rubricoccaceae bacterium]|jgi:Tfp pilus assembly protein PilF
MSRSSACLSAAIAFALALAGCQTEAPPAAPSAADAQAADDSVAATVPGLSTDELDAATDSIEAALEPGEHLSQ